MRASQASSRIPRFFSHLGVFLILAGAFLLLAYFSAPAQAQNFGLEAAREGTGIPRLKLAELIGRIISVALGLVGTIFLLLMLYAGFMWMTARGAPDQVKKAKEVLTGAIIGIVIVAGAYAITSLIISSVGVGGGGISEDEAAGDGGTAGETGEVTGFCTSDAECPDGQTCVDPNPDDIDPGECT